MDLEKAKRISWTQPVAVVWKKKLKTEKIQYFINGKEVELHRFKQRIKHLNPVKIIVKEF